MADQRNDLARARDAWLDTDQGMRSLAGIAQGQYLRNRIEAAFISGWTAHEAIVVRALKESADG